MSEYPEREQHLKHVSGKDSKQDAVLSNIPEGMTEREARARGMI